MFLWLLKRFKLKKLLREAKQTPTERISSPTANDIDVEKSQGHQHHPEYGFHHTIVDERQGGIKETSSTENSGGGFMRFALKYRPREAKETSIEGISSPTANGIDVETVFDRLRRLFPYIMQK